MTGAWPLRARVGQTKARSDEDAQPSSARSQEVSCCVFESWTSSCTPGISLGRLGRTRTWTSRWWNTLGERSNRSRRKWDRWASSVKGEVEHCRKMRLCRSSCWTLLAVARSDSLQACGGRGCRIVGGHEFGRCAVEAPGAPGDLQVHLATLPLGRLIGRPSAHGRRRADARSEGCHSQADSQVALRFDSGPSSTGCLPSMEEASRHAYSCLMDHDLDTHAAATRDYVRMCRNSRLVRLRPQHLSSNES